MSFIAVAPTVTTGDTTTINSGDFWPVIDIDQLRQAMRIDGTVTDERLCHAAISAIGEINADLNYWRSEQLANGYTALASVPAEQINGTNIHVHAYRRAVYQPQTWHPKQSKNWRLGRPPTKIIAAIQLAIMTTEPKSGCDIISSASKNAIHVKRKKPFQ